VRFERRLGQFGTVAQTYLRPPRCACQNSPMLERRKGAAHSYLILTQYFPPEVGAPQIRLLAVARELLAAGNRVTVVTAMPNYPLGRVFDGYSRRVLLKETVAGVPVIRTWVRATTASSVPGRLGSYLSFAATSLVGCFRAGRHDVVLVESPPLFLGATAYLFSRLTRARMVLSVSDLWPASAKELGIVTNPLLLAAAERLESFLYRKAYRVAALTEGIYNAVDGRGSVVLFPNGVDARMFTKLAAGPGGKRATFVYTGTHGYAQGLEVIVEAADLLRDRADVEFVLIGDGPDKARVQALAAERGLDNLRFEPSVPVDEMPRILSDARASIVPLRNTPLFRGARPSKIMPALACETPVIFCGEGEAAAILESNACGLVVPPEDPAALAAAVRRLADDPAEAAALGRHGRELVLREFDWSSIVTRGLAEMGLSAGSDA